MISRPAILATAGHVDHGKSSLVKALTGIDPDRLPEEKARGITIDLGFAHCVIEHEGTRWEAGLVDVPGHEDFVKNMVAGVGSIQSALLVIAADDGWMPQTEEHVQILQYLGATHGVVALTKADLAEGSIESVTSDIRASLLGTFLEGAPIIPTSIPRQTGLSALRAAIAQSFALAPRPRDSGKPRLAVDRVFTVKGAGLVVTGTLLGGELQQGQTMIGQPSGARFRVRGLQTANREIDRAVPGMRTALQLHAVDASSSSAGHAQAPIRGSALAWEGSGAATSLMDVEIERSARLNNSPAGAKRPLKSGALIRIHIGTASIAARLVFAGEGACVPGERRLARVRLQQPHHAVVGDRFVIRDWSGQCTLAGGVVLDPAPPRRGFHLQTRQEFLAGMAAGRNDAATCSRVFLRHHRVIERDMLLRTLPFGDAEILAAAGTLVSRGEAVQIASSLIDKACWEASLDQGGRSVAEHHRLHPESPGLGLSDLRSAMLESLPGPELFEGWLRALGVRGFERSGTFVRHVSHRPALPKHLESAGAAVRARLGHNPMDPPSRKELMPDAPSQQALRYLIQTSEAVELSPEIVILGSALQSARDRVRQHLAAHGPATASQLRQSLQTSRRVLIPLLERLDKEGWTRRQGDLRVIGPAAGKQA